MAVVDDDRSMRNSLQRLLGAHGFRTETYPSAEDFLARCVEDDIFCMILDVHLGGMSGVGLRRRLKDSGSRLPVIFITAMDDDGLEAQARAEGCVAYLRKPFPAKALIDAIDMSRAFPSGG